MALDLMKYGTPIGKINEEIQPANVPQENRAVTAIKEAWQGGKEMMGQAIQESQAGRNPLETGLKFGAGAINAVSAPLAPIFQPLSEGINAVANKVGDIPQVQKFATGKYGSAAIRGAEDIQNLSTVAGTVAGAAEGQIRASQLVKERIATPETAMNVRPENYTAELQKVAQDWTRPAQENSAKFNKTRIALQKTPETPKFLAEQGLNPFTHIDDGKYFTQESAQAMRETAGKMSRDTLRPSLQMADYTTPKTPVAEVLKGSNLKVDRNLNLTAGDVKSIKNMVQSELEALSKKYPEGMSLADMHDEGITYNKNGGYKPFASAADTNKAIANRAIGSAMKKMVENIAPKDVPVNDFNSYLSKYYRAADYLESLHGKVAPVSKMQAAARMAAKFGGAGLARYLIPGAGELISSFAGYQIGKALEHALENMTNPMRDSFLRNLKVTNPEAFTKVSQFVGNEKAAQLTRPQLPAGSFIALPEADKMKYLGKPAKEVLPSQLENVNESSLNSTPKKGLIQSAKDYWNDLPNKQGGFAKNPFAPKDLPENFNYNKILKNISGEDLQIMRAYLNKPTHDSFVKAQPMLKAMGLDNIKESRVQEVFRDLIQDSTKQLPVKSGVSNFTKGERGLFTGSTSKSLEPLVQEARKYKSAETTLDRVLSSGETPKVYRGTSDLQKGQIPKEGLSVSFDPSVANSYAKSRGLSGYVDTIKISPKAKIIKLDDIPNSVRSAEEGSDFAGKAAIWARKNGYDILDMSNGNEAELRILNDNVILK